MKKEKMNYGIIVALYPVIYTDAYLFIPKFMKWEKESENAEIMMGDYRIQCNLGTKLLFKTDKGIVEKYLPFEMRGERYVVDIIEYFEKNNIAYKVGGGKYCDGKDYNQYDSSSGVIYNKDVMIEKILSPHWGLQMELYFANKRLRPTIGGKKVKIISFNNCSKEKQNKIEEWFINVVNGVIQVEPYTLDRIMIDSLDRINFTSCCLFYNDDSEWRWAYYC